MAPIAFSLLGFFVAIIFMFGLSRRFGFQAQQPADYASTGPNFDLREHLSGPLLCEGIIYGPTGRVASRFVADMDARWEGNTGRMSENFRFDSGSTQNREWKLTLGIDGSVRAEAPDLIGTGHGVQSGSSVRLNYRIRLPKDAGGHVLDTTDWLYLVENGSIINHSQFRKYGIKVAELVATMRKKPT